MNKRNFIISVVLNILLLGFVGYLAYFRYIYSSSDEYSLKVFPDVTKVYCDSLVERAKVQTNLKKDYLYKWCTDEKYVEVVTVPKVELNSTCESDFFDITIKHNEYWKCSQQSESLVLINSAISMQLVVSDSGRGIFCVEGKDDGCKVTPFVETELGSFDMYESTAKGLVGEIFGAMPGISKGRGVPYLSATYYGSSTAKIGNLNDYQRAELKEIISSMQYND